MKVLLAGYEVKAELIGLSDFLDVDEFAKLKGSVPVALLEVVAHALHDVLASVFDGLRSALHAKHPEVGVELLRADIELLHLNYYAQRYTDSAD